MHKQFLPFSEALSYARSLRLVSEKEWRVWCNSGSRPVNVPFSPDRTYKNGGWQGWGACAGAGPNLPLRPPAARFIDCHAVCGGVLRKRPFRH